MKILERGPGWNIQLRCTGKGFGGGGCNSLLLVEKDDIVAFIEKDMGGVTETSFGFRCPVCNTTTCVSESKIPSSIQSSKIVECEQRRAKVMRMEHNYDGLYS